MVMLKNRYIALLLCFSVLGLALASSASVVCRCGNHCSASQEEVVRSCCKQKPVDLPKCCAARQAERPAGSAKRPATTCCAVPESPPICPSQSPWKAVHAPCSHCQTVPFTVVLAVSVHSPALSAVAAPALAVLAYAPVSVPGSGETQVQDRSLGGPAVQPVLSKTCTLLI